MLRCCCIPPWSKKNYAQPWHGPPLLGVLVAGSCCHGDALAFAGRSWRWHRVVFGWVPGRKGLAGRGLGEASAIQQTDDGRGHTRNDQEVQGSKSGRGAVRPVSRTRVARQPALTPRRGRLARGSHLVPSPHPTPTNLHRSRSMATGARAQDASKQAQGWAEAGGHPAPGAPSTLRRHARLMPGRPTLPGASRCTWTNFDVPEGVVCIASAIAMRT